MSLPTSLIIVGLVAAWLIVLVPMVARRREEVPENDEGTATFRVLERAEKRRRPVMARTAMARRDDEDAMDAGGGDVYADRTDADDGYADDVYSDDVDADDAYADRGEADEADVDTDGRVEVARESDDDLLEELVDDEMTADDDLDWEDDGRRVGRVPEAVGRADERGSDRRRRRDLRRADVEAVVDVAARRGASEGVAARERGLQPQRVDARAGWDLGTRADADRSDAPAPRPVVRSRRGGFDPQAADRARQDRFRRRRRTALVLVLLAVAGAAVGLFGIGYGYVASVVTGSLLVLYFAYLRRQVRIEEDIRIRRQARLERARQIRPQYRPTVAEQVWMHRTGETVRPGAAVVGDYRARSHVRQTVPAAQYGVGVPVDLDDSDPAFDELEYYRPAIRRRRAS